MIYRKKVKHAFLISDAYITTALLFMIKYNLQDCGSRDSKPNMKQRYRNLLTHKPGNRHPHAKCTKSPLEHVEGCSAASIKITHKAESERSKHTVDCICLQILLSR